MLDVRRYRPAGDQVGDFIDLADAEPGIQVEGLDDGCCLFKGKFEVDFGHGRVSVR
jgi:hypothetical protein